MKIDATEIIFDLNNFFPDFTREALQNSFEPQTNQSQKPKARFIIGIAGNGETYAGPSSYQLAKEKELAGVTDQLRFLKWGFEISETEEMKFALEELGGKLNIPLDAEKMMKPLNINKDSKGMNYIMITLVGYPGISE